MNGMALLYLGAALVLLLRALAAKADLTIGPAERVSETRITRTVFEYTMRAKLTNPSWPALDRRSRRCARHLRTHRETRLDLRPRVDLPRDRRGVIRRMEPAGLPERRWRVRVHAGKVVIDFSRPARDRGLGE